MTAITAGTVLVFGLVLVALALFAAEPVPVDVTAIGVMVALLAVEPLTAALARFGLLAAPIPMLSPQQGLSGFANAATITVLAMFVLSEGVQRTGIVQRLGAAIAGWTRDSEGRQLGATVGIVGPLSGIINNTAAVAVLLPMVVDLADRGNTSPSKLLLPLSYASMFGGTLTLIGTSTNILASEVYARLSADLPADAPYYTGEFSVFLFTPLGLVLLVVGTAYLLTVGRWLTPARIPPSRDLTDEFDVAEYLTEVVVREDSPLVGKRTDAVMSGDDLDVDLLQLVRDEETYAERFGAKTIRAGDVFVVRTDRDTLLSLLGAEGLDLVPEVDLDDDELEAASRSLVEVVVAPGSGLVGETLASASFRQRYSATVLALRRGRELIRRRMEAVPLRVGDTLLLQATPDSVERLDAANDVIVARDVEHQNYRTEKTPIAIGIVVAVVLVAALNVLPIVVAALAGSLAMVLTGCLKPPELYEAVRWDVIFLLAGVIPLGIALETTGGAELLAAGVVATAAYLPPIGVLATFYVVTALLTNVVSNNASVVLMIPVAVEAALSPAVEASPFAFVLAVTFAASTAFMTPVGYQTNLFVYGPGGYRFTDYLRVGGPLQLLFAVITTLGIVFFFGL